MHHILLKRIRVASLGLVAMLTLAGCATTPVGSTLTLRPGVTMPRPAWSCTPAPATLEKLTIAEPQGIHELLLKTRCEAPTTTLTLYSPMGVALARITISPETTQVTPFVPVSMPIPYDMVVANYMLANLEPAQTVPLLPRGWHWETDEVGNRILWENSEAVLILNFQDGSLQRIILPKEHVTMTLTPLPQNKERARPR